jgi:hypothetical protein
VGNFIKDSILLSAYDIYHGHLRDPGRYFPDKELIFIDSGGYELSPGFDPTEPVHHTISKRTFSRENYIQVLEQLPKDLPFVITNYDWGTRKKKLTEQIAAAQTLFYTVPPLCRPSHLLPSREEHWSRRCKAR